MTGKKRKSLAGRLLCLTLALCLGFSSCTALAASKDTQDKIDKVKQEKNEAEEEKKKTEQEQNKLNNAKSEMENYLKELDNQSKSLNEQVAELDQQITDKESQVSSMEGRIEEAQADLDKQYEDMKTRIQYMYENDQTAVQNIITAALTGGLTGLLNQVEYTLSVNQYDRNMLENYKASKADLDDQYAKLQDEQDALDVLNDRLCIYDSLDGVRPAGEEDELLVTAKNEVTESFRYMIGNISRIIDYYISRNTDVNFTSINLCGLGAGVRGLNILLASEIGQRVEIVYALAGCIHPDFPKHEGLYLYTAVIAPARSGVNLLEKTSRRKKEEKDSLSGAILICAVGVIAGVALAGAGIVNRIYQQHIYDHLNERITEESSVQDIYDAYMAAKDNYGNYENMYDKTNTPNENLRDFLEEMEQKMPSDMTVESFTSTGTGVVFTLRTSGKSEAATVLIQLRTFESLATVTTTGLDEDENGNVAMTVSCTYSEPAGLDLEESE